MKKQKIFLVCIENKISVLKFTFHKLNILSNYKYNIEKLTVFFFIIKCTLYIHRDSERSSKFQIHIIWLYLQSPMVQYMVTNATDMRGMTVSPAKLAL